MCDDEQFALDPDVSGRDSSISNPDSDRDQQAKFRIEVSYVRQVSR